MMTRRMKRNEDRLIDDRRRYVDAFAATMLEIWREKMALLGVLDTGALFSSVASGYSIHDNEVSGVTFHFNFLEYGIYVDAGSGREVPRGNPGDIGRQKVRQPKRWYRPKYYMSLMNIREFFAESFSIRFVALVDEVLSAR